MAGRPATMAVRGTSPRRTADRVPLRLRGGKTGGDGQRVRWHRSGSGNARDATATRPATMVRRHADSKPTLVTDQHERRPRTKWPVERRATQQNRVAGAYRNGRHGALTGQASVHPLLLDANPARSARSWAMRVRQGRTRRSRRAAPSSGLARVARKFVMGRPGPGPLCLEHNSDKRDVDSVTYTPVWKHASKQVRCGPR